MNTRHVFAFLCTVFITCAFPATHVFWYKALQNGYNLSENPGPNLTVLPENIHEGLVATQSDVGYPFNTLILGTTGQPWISNIAFFDLNLLKGTITTAKLRAEWADLREYHIPGPIRFQIGVEDVWQRAGWPEMDILFVCHSGLWGLIYRSDYFINGTIDTISFTIPQGKSDTGQYPPPLAKQFIEFNVTNQIRYILQNNDSLKSKFLILRFKVINGTGRFSGLAYKNCDSSQLYDEITTDMADGAYTDFSYHWSKDGNTAHLVVEGNLPSSTSREPYDPISFSNPTLLNTPNPFNPSTTIEYALPGNRQGNLTIFDVSGNPILRKRVSGRGSYSWNARGLSSGIYFCRLSGAGKSYTRKLIYTK